MNAEPERIGEMDTNPQVKDSTEQMETVEDILCSIFRVTWDHFQGPCDPGCRMEFEWIRQRCLTALGLIEKGKGEES